MALTIKEISQKPKIEHLLRANSDLRISARPNMLILSYLDHPSYIGMSKRIKGIIKVLEMENISISVLCPIFLYSWRARANKDYYNYIDIRFLQKMGTTRLLTRLLALLLYSFFALLKIVKLKPKIIQYQTLYSSVPAILAKYLTRSVIIGDDILWDNLCTHGILRSFFMILLSLTDIILTPSMRVKNYIKKVFPAKLTLYVSNGVDEVSQISMPTNRAVFIGTFTYSENLKALERIVRVSEHLKKCNINFEIVIIGGPLHLISSFIRNDENLLFAGIVSESELEKIYSSSFIGLAPFFAEVTGGQRMKCLEYFAHGLLVVSGKAGVDGILGVRDGIHFIFVNSEVEMMEKLKNIFREPNKYVEIARAGRSFILTNFSWRKVLEDYVRMIKELLSGQMKF